MTRTSGETRRSTRRAVRFLVVKVLASWMASLLVAAWVWAPRASGAGGTTAPIAAIGKLPVPSGLTSVVTAVDSTAGIIYEVGSDTNTNGCAIQEVDAGNHQYIAPMIDVPPVDETLVPKTGNLGGPSHDRILCSGAPVVDRVGHRLFLPIDWNSPTGVANPSGIYVFNGRTRTFDHPGQPIVPYITTSGNARSGNLEITLTNNTQYLLSYDTGSQRLYLEGLTATAPVSDGLAASTTDAPPIWVDEIDPAPEKAQVDWSFPMLGCGWIPSSFGGSPSVYGGSMWVMCGGQNADGAEPPEFTQAIVQVPLTVASGGAPSALSHANNGETFYPVPGGYNAGTAAASGYVLGDQGGSRILLISPNPGPNQIMVFDVPTHRIVGLIANYPGSQYFGACVNDTTGRFYLLTQPPANSPSGIQDTGLLIGEARASGSPYPQVAADAGLVLNGQMSCDDSHHEILLTHNNSNLISVYKDQTPAYSPPPPPPDPDQATTGGPYDPTSSTLSFEGDGRGFGAQVRDVGGYNAILENNADGLTGLEQANQAGGQAGAQVPSPADVVAPQTPMITLGASGIPGSPQSVTLSDSQSTSAAEGATTDSGLQADLGQGGRGINQLEAAGGGGGPPPPGQLSDPWAYSAVTCAGGPGAKTQSFAGAGSMVTCGSDQASATSDASGPTDFSGMIRVVGAGSSVTNKLDQKTGVLTTTTQAWAKVISINNGEIEIDNAVATAVSQAGGQAGSAKSKYTRSVGQLVIGGNVVCAPCDPGQVASAIDTNPFTEASVNAIVPVPQGAQKQPGDESYDIPGTPGGAQAAVVNDPSAQLEDQAMNEQSSYDQEVPALRLEIQNNTYQHIAVILDVAAPQTFSRLDILPCDSCAAAAPAAPTALSAPPVTVPSASATTPDSTPPPAQSNGPEAAPTSGPPAGAPGFAAVPTAFSTPEPSATSASQSFDVSGPNGGGAPGALPGALGQLGGGLRAALTSGKRFLELMLVWIVMALPVYLSARRRLVVDHILGPRQEGA